MVVIVTMIVRGAGEGFEHIFQSGGVAERQDMAVAVRRQRFAIPVAHQAACTFDHRHQRGEIIALQARFDDDVEEARREQAVIIAIAAIDRP